MDQCVELCRAIRIFKWNGKIDWMPPFDSQDKTWILENSIILHEYLSNWSGRDWTERFSSVLCRRLSSSPKTSFKLNAVKIQFFVKLILKSGLKLSLDHIVDIQYQRKFWNWWLENRSNNNKKIKKNDSQVAQSIVWFSPRKFTGFWRSHKWDNNLIRAVVRRP